MCPDLLFEIAWSRDPWHRHFERAEDVRDEKRRGGEELMAGWGFQIEARRCTTAFFGWGVAESRGGGSPVDGGLWPGGVEGCQIEARRWTTAFFR